MSPPADTPTALMTCSACPDGQFQDAAGHRIVDCKTPDPPCGAGRELNPSEGCVDRDTPTTTATPTATPTAIPTANPTTNPATATTALLSINAECDPRNDRCDPALELQCDPTHYKCRYAIDTTATPTSATAATAPSTTAAIGTTAPDTSPDSAADSNQTPSLDADSTQTAQGMSSGLIAGVVIVVLLAVVGIVLVVQLRNKRPEGLNGVNHPAAAHVQNAAYQGGQPQPSTARRRCACASKPGLLCPGRRAVGHLRCRGGGRGGESAVGFGPGAVERDGS